MTLSVPSEMVTLSPSCGKPVKVTLPVAATPGSLASVRTMRVPLTGTLASWSAVSMRFTSSVKVRTAVLPAPGTMDRRAGGFTSPSTVPFTASLPIVVAVTTLPATSRMVVKVAAMASPVSRFRSFAPAVRVICA